MACLQPLKARLGLVYLLSAVSIQTVVGHFLATAETAVPGSDGSRSQPAQLIVNEPTAPATLHASRLAALNTASESNLETVLLENPAFRLDWPDPIAGLTSQPDGRWFVRTCTRHELPLRFIPTLKRLTADFTSDPTFSLGFEPESCINEFAFQADGKIVLCGGFSTSEGDYSAWIARLNEDGSKDESFQPPNFQSAANVNDPQGRRPIVFRSAEVVEGGKLFIAGQFLVSQGNVSHRGLVRLMSDGTLDPTFHLNASNVNSIDILLIEPGGKLLLRLESAAYGTGLSEMIRVDANGARDPEFKVTPTELQSRRMLLRQSDGKLLLHGYPESESMLIRLNPDGSRDGTFTSPKFESRPASNGWWRGPAVTAAFQLEDSSLLIGGLFDWVEGISRRGFVRLFPNGELDQNFRAELPDHIQDGSEYWPSVSSIFKKGNSLLALISYATYTDPNLVQPAVWKEFLFTTSPATSNSFQLSAGLGHSVTEDQREAVVSVFRVGSLTEPAAVRFQLKAGSAQEGLDYEPQIGRLEFTPGERKKQIYIQILEDSRVEADESIQVILHDPVPGMRIEGPDSTVVRIINDDSGFEFSPTDYRVGELDRLIALRVRRTGVNIWPVTVDYESQSGTAIEREDYIPYQGTLSFDYAAQTEAHILIQIRDDPVAEADETFQVVLRNPTGGASLEPNVPATVTIADNDKSTRSGRGVDGKILALAAQANGYIMAGGVFTTIHGHPRISLARLTADLSLDESFDARLDLGTQIRRIAVHLDGRVTVTGTFSNIQGVVRSHFAQFNNDGSLNRAFDPVFEQFASRLGDPPFVNCVAALPDGKTLVGGEFAKVNGIVRVGIVRLNSDGSVDRDFSHGSFFEPPQYGGYANDIVVQPDDRILLAGLGNTLRDLYHNSLVRLESGGGLDPGFSVDLKRTGYWGNPELFRAYSLALQRNGQILALEPAYQSDFRVGSPLIRLNPDGTRDTHFDTRSPWSTGMWQWREVNAVLEGSDGSLWLGGKGRLARLRSDGSLDIDALNKISLGSRAPLVLYEFEDSSDDHIRQVWTETPEVNAFALKPDGRVIIGGNFVSYSGISAYSMVEVHADGTPTDLMPEDLMRLEVPKLLDNGAVSIGLIVPPGQPIFLMRSTNFKSWQPVLNITPATNRIEFVDPEPIRTRRFYKAIWNNF